MNTAKNPAAIRTARPAGSSACLPAERESRADADLGRCLSALRASAGLPYAGAIRGFVYERGGGLRERG